MAIDSSKLIQVLVLILLNVATTSVFAYNRGYSCTGNCKGGKCCGYPTLAVCRTSCKGISCGKDSHCGGGLCCSSSGSRTGKEGPSTCRSCPLISGAAVIPAVIGLVIFIVITCCAISFGWSCLRKKCRSSGTTTQVHNHSTTRRSSQDFYARGIGIGSRDLPTAHAFTVDSHQFSRSSGQPISAQCSITRPKPKDHLSSVNDLPPSYQTVVDHDRPPPSYVTVIE